MTIIWPRADRNGLGKVRVDMCWDVTDDSTATLQNQAIVVYERKTGIEGS